MHSLSFTLSFLILINSFDEFTLGKPLLYDGEAEGEAQGQVRLLQPVLDHELSQAAGDMVEEVLAGAQHQLLAHREDLGLHHKVALAAIRKAITKFKKPK